MGLVGSSAPDALDSLLKAQLDDVLLLQRIAARVPVLSNSSRTRYLALHAFHSTGLEGNTLTLPETLATVAGQPLFAGFDPRMLPSHAATLSLTEALNVAQLWDALGLSSLPDPGLGCSLPLDLPRIGLQAVVDLNSAITRNTHAHVPFGVRRHAVGIGHKKVMLPMPDEVPR